MSVALITHPACLEHDTGTWHPECPDRLRSVLRALEDEAFQPLLREASAASDGGTTHPRASRRLRAGDPGHPARARAAPCARRRHGDERRLAPRPRLRAAGGAVRGGGRGDGGLGARRLRRRPPARASRRDQRDRWGSACSPTPPSPPGTRRRAGGSRRVAVVDFDVHHGNGTQAMFCSDAGPVLRLQPPVPLLSRHRGRGRTRRGGQCRQRAAGPGRDRRRFPRRLGGARFCRRSTPSRPSC